ncbi:MAG: tRNA dihydrouridine synthase DusB [Acidimicrobiia bacterium]
MPERSRLADRGASLDRRLSIGPYAVDPPVLLAPMAGVTNAPFRGLCRRYGGGLYVSEMLTARALVEGNRRTRRLASFGPGEEPRSAQLYGVDPGVVSEAVRALVGEYGAQHVDLNFGCPVPKITRKGGGAALPLHRVLLGRIIAAAVGAAAPSGVPVTVKFRLGVDLEHLTYLETGRIAEAEGAAAVALHARTAEQRYGGAADWDAIGALKAAVSSIPVLGNGDIWEAVDALAMMAATGCDGVVVGRGCLGRPWLFGDLAAAFAGGPVAPPPALGEVVTVMREHARLLVEWHEDETAGVRDFRKHAGWYLLGYPVGGENRRRVGLASSLAELDRLLRSFDPTVVLPDGRAPRGRGKSDGPRPVVLPAGWLDNLDDPTPPGQDAERVTSGG